MSTAYDAVLQTVQTIPLALPFGPDDRSRGCDVDVAVGHSFPRAIAPADGIFFRKRMFVRRMVMTLEMLHMFEAEIAKFGVRPSSRLTQLAFRPISSTRPSATASSKPCLTERTRSLTLPKRITSHRAFLSVDDAGFSLITYRPGRAAGNR